MPYPYIIQAELESRVSAAVVARVLDDNDDGIADTNAITQVIADASSKVAGYLRPMYNLSDVSDNTPEEVKRLTLDVAHAYLTQRHPEFFRGDGESMMRAAVAELKDLRRGTSRLDVEGSPEPAANTGGTIEQGDPSTFVPDTFRPVFQWDDGDY